MTTDEPMAPLRHYSAALDEIYWLRTLLAWEAGVLSGHMELKTFPKSRRRFAEESIARMQAAARGETGAVLLDDKPSRSVRLARDEAGMSQTLTRYKWEASNDECASPR